MKKIITILLILISVKGFSQQNILVGQQGTNAYIAYGLSTNTKTVSPPDGSYFIETNTGNIYYATGGVWTLPTKQKTIKSLSEATVAASSLVHVNAQLQIRNN